MTTPRLNCAIYTRKSSEEGLEQSFNSLDAQREACEAYIKSQKHEGWHAIPTLYDDGGFSGGNMERPALKKLLADIDARKVNVVVVYKVDRLTRALSDFAKIVEQFDKQGVSFVSVTQAFNTTTSMGRLTLNVLLSFAQFEREVTGERIRDKVAASKKKGMWMGGVVPLGYVVKDKTLVPVHEEAKKVRHIYERYLVLGNVRELQVELKRDNILGKIRVPNNKQKIHNHNLARGALYVMLRNPLYIGRVRHGDKNYQGQHKATVPEDLWQAVQKKLDDNRVEHSGKSHASHSLLTGLLFDAKDQKLTPTSTNKNGKRYRYYVHAVPNGKTNKGLRLPAGELEDLIIGKLRARLPEEIPELAHELKPVLIRSVEKIIIHADRIAIHLKDGDCLPIDYRFSRLGRYRQLITDVQPNAASEAQRQTLLRAFLQGYVWRKRFQEGVDLTIAAIAKAEEKNENYIARLIYFSFMAPDLIARILKGDVPAHVSASDLTRDLPISWAGQRISFNHPATVYVY